MNRNTSPLFQLIILISIITFGFADTLSAADADGLTITVEANQSIRDIAQKYLNNPDLWEDILRENKLKSAADVKPGMQLFIPVKAITSAIAELDKSHKTIQEATQAGAKIFATEDINRAIDNRNRALEARKSSDWNQCTSLAKTATTAAAKALELSKAQQDVATEASIYRRTGNVQGKRPEQNLWNELALNSRLIEGERVRTLSSSYAEIQFRDESRIRMNENSQTLIRRVRANLLEKKEEASVSLIEGDVMALLAQGSGKKKGKGAFEIDVPGVKTDLNSDHFWIGSQEGTSRFANYDGEVTVEAAGAAVTIKENQGSVIRKNEKPSKPEQLLLPPVLSAPDNRAEKYSAGFDLVWNKVTGAGSYRIELSTEEQFSALLAVWSAKSENYKMSLQLENGVYFWRVCAISKEGLPGKFSSSRSFLIVKDSRPPFITVSNPIDGMVVSEGPITITGNTEAGAGVTVGDKSVKVDPNGDFTTAYDLKPGVNTIVIKATDQAGNATTVERKVTYQAEGGTGIQIDPAIPRMDDGTILSSGRAISINGLSEIKATLTIHDRFGSQLATTVAGNDGIFQFNISLIQDRNDFVIKVKTLAGQEFQQPLVVEVDELPPEILLDEDIPAATASGILIVAGVVEQGTILSCETETIPVAGGRFTKEFKLVEGSNTIKLSAKDIAGNVAFLEGVVILDREPPKLLRTDVTPKTVTEGGVVTVTVTAGDPNGLAKVAPVVVVSGSGMYQGYLRLTGTDTYTGTVQIPANISGSVALKKVTLSDYLGNSKEYEF